MANIRIIGRMVKFSRLTFETNNIDELRQELIQLFADRNYVGAPVVINSTVPQDLIPLIQLLMEFGLQPIAVLDGILAEDAHAIQFPVLPADQQDIKRITPTSEQETATQPAVTVAPIQINANPPAVESVVEQVSPAPTPAPAPAPVVTEQIVVTQRKTIYHADMLRTGHSLIEEDADIVLTANMNSGSEIIAGGNVYIYGAGRGRIIAGVNGDQNARIFCHSLEANLISIAGSYCLADDIPSEFLQKPVQIWLNAQQELQFGLLNF